MHMYRRVKGGDDYILGLDEPTRCKVGLTEGMTILLALMDQLGVK